MCGRITRCFDTVYTRYTRVLHVIAICIVIDFGDLSSAFARRQIVHFGAAAAAYCLGSDRHNIADHSSDVEDGPAVCIV